MKLTPQTVKTLTINPGRRSFIKSSALAFGGAIALSSLPGWPGAASGPPSGKKILFLGGTNFIGPIFINELLKSGHSVTLFKALIYLTHIST